PAIARFRAPSSRSYPGESRTSTEENPPRRSARARASPPSALFGLVPSESLAGVSFHLLSGCTAAAPPAVDTCLLATLRRALRGRDRRRAARYRRSSLHRRPPHLCSSSLASTPSEGRRSSRCGRTARGSAASDVAWPQHQVDRAVVALFRPTYVGRGR